LLPAARTITNNRANDPLPILQKDGDYAAFERILGEALEHVPGMRLR
jgi:hypothetical protein